LKPEKERDIEEKVEGKLRDALYFKGGKRKMTCFEAFPGYVRSSF
jgi:hypothetical protein